MPKNRKHKKSVSTEAETAPLPDPVEVGSGESAQEDFEADIRIPDDLPLPESELGHQRRHCKVTPIEESKTLVEEEFQKVSRQMEREKSLEESSGNAGSDDAESVDVAVHDQDETKMGLPNGKVEHNTGADISHDAIHFNTSSIVSLGEVDKNEAFAHLQDFQKELLVEGTGSPHTPSAEPAIKCLGPVTSVEEELCQGFQKGLTLGAGNTDRPDEKEAETTIQIDQSPSTEAKGFLARLVDRAATAAGTVIDYLLPALEILEESVSESQVGPPKSSRTKTVENEVYEDEKGLVDTAVEKIWNVLTGKDDFSGGIEDKQDNGYDNSSKVVHQQQPTEDTVSQQYPQQILQKKQQPFLVPAQQMQPVQPQFIPTQQFVSQPQFLPQAFVGQPGFVQVNQQHFQTAEQMAVATLMAQQQQQAHLSHAVLFVPNVAAPAFVPSNQQGPSDLPELSNLASGGTGEAADGSGQLDVAMKNQPV